CLRRERPANIFNHETSYTHTPVRPQLISVRETSYRTPSALDKSSSAHDAHRGSPLMECAARSRPQQRTGNASRKLLATTQSHSRILTQERIAVCPYLAR